MCTDCEQKTHTHTHTRAHAHAHTHSHTHSHSLTQSVLLSSRSGNCVANLQRKRMNCQITSPFNPYHTPLPQALQGDAVLVPLVPREEHGHLKRGDLQVIPTHLVLEDNLCPI